VTEEVCAQPVHTPGVYAELGVHAVKLAVLRDAAIAFDAGAVSEGERSKRVPEYVFRGNGGVERTTSVVNANGNCQGQPNLVVTLGCFSLRAYFAALMLHSNETVGKGYRQLSGLSVMAIVL
jgi:hypothetical protein